MFVAHNPRVKVDKPGKGMYMMRADSVTELLVAMTNTLNNEVPFKIPCAVGCPDLAAAACVRRQIPRPRGCETCGGRADAAYFEHRPTPSPPA